MRKITFFTAALFPALLVTSCHKPCECSEGPVTETPGNIIPLAEADSLYQNYGNSRVSLIELAENITEEGDTIPKGDANYKRATRAVKFSYKELKQYLAYIEQEAEAAGVDILELRVYFGKYPNTFKQKNKKGRATVFLNPASEFTLADGTKDTVSYAIITGIDGKKRAEMVGKILNPKEGEEGAVEGEEIDSQSGDRGGVIPPPFTDPNDFQ